MASKKRGSRLPTYAFFAVVDSDESDEGSWNPGEAYFALFLYQPGILLEFSDPYRSSSQTIIQAYKIHDTELLFGRNKVLQNS